MPNKQKKLRLIVRRSKDSSSPIISCCFCAVFLVRNHQSGFGGGGGFLRPCQEFKSARGKNVMEPKNNIGGDCEQRFLTAQRCNSVFPYRQLIGGGRGGDSGRSVMKFVFPIAYRNFFSTSFRDVCQIET